MTNLLTRQMELVSGGDDLTIEEYCMINSGGGLLDRLSCEQDMRAGASQGEANNTLNPLIAGCFAGGIFAILLGFVNPILGRLASVGVSVGCALAKVGSL